MGDTTGIEWTDSTWNPVRGCSRVSEGCRHCYAETVAARFSGPGLPYEGLARRTASGEARWTGEVRLVPEHLDGPLRWKRPRRIFVNSMSDLFHDNLGDEEIAAAFGVMARARWHTLQVLTKRADRMLRFFAQGDSIGTFIAAARRAGVDMDPPTNEEWRQRGPLPNVWLGVSVENQAAADERIPLLLKTPAAVRFLSCEPLLGPVDLTDVQIASDASEDVLGDGDPRDEPGIDWVIVGGESGPGARPMHPDWARSLRDQCARASVPFFFKKWGEWVPRVRGEGLFNSNDPHGRDRLVSVDGNVNCFVESAGPGAAPMSRVGKKAAGSLLDAVEHKAFPEVRHGR